MHSPQLLSSSPHRCPPLTAPLHIPRALAAAHPRCTPPPHISEIHLARLLFFPHNQVMAKICREAEASIDYYSLFKAIMKRTPLPMTPLESLASSAVSGLV